MLLLMHLRGKVFSTLLQLTAACEGQDRQLASGAASRLLFLPRRMGGHGRRISGIRQRYD